MSARPFVKWIGGKASLADKILSEFPSDFDCYVEPFVGGGAVLFRVLQAFPRVHAVINDANPALVATYRAVRDNVGELIDNLRSLEDLYLHAPDRKALYLAARAEFNACPTPALLIFLNKTCFNGLYRTNRQGEFNAAFGKYKNPAICDIENLHACSQLLQRCEILCGDFSETLSHVPAPEKAVFYFDPPYKPISKTANFTRYTAGGFGNKDQVRLRDFCVKLDSMGAHWVLSNSDPASGFFRELYKGFRIQTVSALRKCAQDATSRGYVGELLISNGTPAPELLAPTFSPASPETDSPSPSFSRGNHEGSHPTPLSHDRAKACPPQPGERTQSVGAQ